MTQIQITNLRMYPQKSLSFGEYLKLPGFSHSTIKQMQRGKMLIETEAMNLGTKCHHYLLEPELYQHESNEVKDIAMSMKEKLGEAVMYLEPEEAFTCDLTWEGLTMPFKGRVDLSKKGRMVVDVKVVETKNIMTMIDWFGYDNQLSGYGMGFGTNLLILCWYSKKLKKTTLTHIPFTDKWWKEQIIANGY